MNPTKFITKTLILLTAIMPNIPTAAEERPRARDLGLDFGKLPTGLNNSITDVPDLLVGQVTLIKDDHIRTGVTVILPHPGNIYDRKVPAAVYVENGYGKLIGSTQINELGTLESPIALTSTLNVWRVADGLADYMLSLSGNEGIRSINIVVGETNDGGLNDIRSRPVGTSHVRLAIENATSGPIQEGSVGAGTGTRCLGWKGGIGTASRKVGPHHLGVLVQSNFGGTLSLNGIDINDHLKATSLPDRGSCMIIVATDAIVDHHSLMRIAKRSFGGMARIGASFSNGSGDYAIAFSTRPISEHRESKHLREQELDPFFRAVVEATEEAIANSIVKATTLQSKFGTSKAIDIGELRKLLSSKGIMPVNE